MTSPACSRIHITATRFARRACRHFRSAIGHLFVRALILALILQLFPLQLLSPGWSTTTGGSGDPLRTEGPESPFVLGLADISRLVGPGVAHAEVTSLTKTAPAEVDQGEAIQYTLYVANTDDAIFDPFVFDVIDTEHLRFLSFNTGGSPGWAASNSNPAVSPITVTFFPRRGVMATGETAVLTINLQARSPITDGTVIANDLYYATWIGGQFTLTEPATTRINAPAFSLGSQASGASVCAGERVTYTLYLTNSGHLATRDKFTLTVDLDDGVAFAGAASPQPTHNNGTLTWANIDQILDPGESIQRTFWVIVSPEVEHETVLAHLARAASPQDVTPDGTLWFTSTVQRVAADFATADPVCVGDVLTFTRLYADVTVLSGYWDWGDDSYTDSPAAQVTHTYASGGIYTVTHVVTGVCGVTQTHTYAAAVFVDGVSTSFEPATTVSVCLGSSVSFTATDAVSSAVVARLWNFGDGTTLAITDAAESMVTATHTYSSTGRYTVTLTVTNETGCAYTFALTDAVLVDGIIPDFQPAALITACLGSPMIFTDTSFADSGIAVREWDLGDGTVTRTAAMTIPHTYVSGGYYTVTLQVTNTTGCSDVISRPGIVFVDSALVDLVATPLTTCVGGEVTFTSTSVTSSTIVDYAWNFGDGVIAHAPDMPQVTHVYTIPGYHTVALTITTAGGCPFSVTRPDYIFVDGLNPNLEPSAPITVCSGDATVYLTDTSAISSSIVAHRWDWGDGTIDVTGNVTTATHTYAAAGTYTVTLTVTSANGCAGTIVRPNHVFVNRVEAMISEPSPPVGLCLDENTEVTFVSGSVTSDTINGITGHRWDFGDGTIALTGPTTTVTHTYARTGSFTVTLTVTSGECSDTVVSPAHIIVDQIFPGFEPTQRVTVCKGATVYLTDTSAFSAMVVSRTWDFGDGTSSPNLSSTIYASHTYTAAGLYTVRLTLSTVGCTDRYAEYVGLVSVEEATAAFTNPAAACPGADVPFTYTGTYSGALGSLVWDFGDGQVLDAGTTTTATHRYAAPGTYNVVLTVTTSAGCQAVASGSVSIEGAVASFEPPTPQRVCVNALLTFNSTSVASGTIAAYLWDFGDGGTSTSAVAQHAYASTGSYTVSLTVETGAGCPATVTRPNWVTVEDVTAVISPPSPIPACIDQPVAFSDQSTSIPPGSIVARRWDFGDGTTSSEQDPVHAFASGGTFNVTLVVTTAGGCVESDSVTVNVQGAAVGFDGPTAVCYSPGGVTVDWINTTTYIGTLDYWEWRFSDGGTSTDWDASHTYAAPGTYTVTLFLSTTAGCTYEYERSIAVEELSVSMVHTPPDMVCAGTPVQFVDTSDVTGTIVSRLWEFGDGTAYDSGTSAVTTHAYDAGGTYAITLTVTTEGGCSDWVTSTIDVDDIRTAFVIDTPLPACLGTTIHFSDTSSAASGIAAVRWNFGDGGSSAARAVDHLYTSPGTYIVQLTATNGNGCQRTVSQTVTIESVTAAIDVPGGTAVCEGDTVTLNDASTAVGTISSWFWEFSDGQTATTPNVSRAFGTPGTYAVTLTVATAAGCADTASIEIDVEAYPAPNIAIDPVPAVKDEVTRFDDTGTGGRTWEWNFGDGTGTGPRSTPGASHTYRSAGTFMVVLTVTSPSGCVSVARQSLVVVEFPPVGEVRVTADPNEIVAGTSTEICVFVTDTLGAPITDGTPVQLYALPADLGRLEDSVLTTTNGTACTTFTANSPASGMAIIYGQAGGKSDQVAVQILAEFQVDLALERNAIDVDERIYLTVTVRDWEGQLVPDGTMVTLTQSPALGEFANGSSFAILPTSGGVVTTTYIGNSAGQTSLTAAVQGYVDVETLFIALRYIYLPLVLHTYGSDLEVLSVQVVFGATDQDPDYVLVTIGNNGQAPASGFWVDLYLDPPRPPEPVEIWPDLCRYGKAWYVNSSLDPGQTLVLDTRAKDDPQNPHKRYSIWLDELPAGEHELYAQVDSYWKPYGLVSELNEGNNVYGPLSYKKPRASAIEPTPVPAPHPPETGREAVLPASTPAPRPALPEEPVPTATATPIPGP